MARSTSRRVLVAVVVIVSLQGMALGIYRLVERARSSGPGRDFVVERVDGGEAPEMRLERADGERVRLREQLDGVALVHFWATWCEPCVEELPGLLEAARRHDDLTLLAISLDDDWGPVRRFFDGDVPPEVHRSATEDEHLRYEVYSLPETYLVSRDGRLVLRYGGARDWRSAPAAAHLAEAVRR